MEYRIKRVSRQGMAAHAIELRVSEMGKADVVGRARDILSLLVTRWETIFKSNEAFFFISE